MKEPFTSLLVTEPIEGVADIVTQIPLDVRQAETHSFSATVTEHPVEEGSLVTDHVHLQPDAISLEGFVSNTPVASIPASVAYLKGDTASRQGYSRSADAYDVLMMVYRARTPLTVVTRYQIFEDMIIEGLEIPQSRDRGTGLWFSMKLKKITIVETLTAALPPDVVAALKRRRKKTLAKLKAKTLEAKYGKQKAKWIEQGNLSKEMADDETDESAKATLAKYWPKSDEDPVVEREPT